MKELRLMMYNWNAPSRHEGRSWADKHIEELEKRYVEEEFWEYMKNKLSHK